MRASLMNELNTDGSLHHEAVKRMKIQTSLLLQSVHSLIHRAYLLFSVYPEYRI